MVAHICVLNLQQVDTETGNRYAYFDTLKERIELRVISTRGQSNLTKSASRRAHSSVRGHPRGSKVVPLNSWGRVSY